MAQIIWPDSPFTGQLYTSDLGDVWRWNGYAWDFIGGEGGGGGNLPVPKVWLHETNETELLDLYDSATGGSQPEQAFLCAPPVVTAMDLTEDMIGTGVWLEMVVYKRKYTKRAIIDGNPVILGKKNKRGYVIPPGWDGTQNTLMADLGINASTRGGELTDVTVRRPNHAKITSVNETIPVWQYLHNRFTVVGINYRNALGSIQDIDIAHPVQRRKVYGTMPSGRFSYSPGYTPMYIAFRYIMYNESSRSFVSGPLSRVVKVTLNRHPFILNQAATVSVGKPCCDISEFYTGEFGDPFAYKRLKCMFETKLP
jgi:hypothetical protein